MGLMYYVMLRNSSKMIGADVKCSQGVLLKDCPER